MKHIIMNQALYINVVTKVFDNRNVSQTHNSFDHTTEVICGRRTSSILFYQISILAGSTTTLKLLMRIVYSSCRLPPGPSSMI